MVTDVKLLNQTTPGIKINFKLRPTTATDPITEKVLATTIMPDLLNGYLGKRKSLFRKGMNFQATFFEDKHFKNNLTNTLSERSSDSIELISQDLLPVLAFYFVLLKNINYKMWPLFTLSFCSSADPNRLTLSRKRLTTCRGASVLAFSSFAINQANNRAQQRELLTWIKSFGAQKYDEDRKWQTLKGVLGGFTVLILALISFFIADAEKFISFMQLLPIMNEASLGMAFILVASAFIIGATVSLYRHAKACDKQFHDDLGLFYFTFVNPRAVKGSMDETAKNTLDERGDAHVARNGRV